MKKDLKFSQVVERLQEIMTKLEAGEPELEEIDKLVAEGWELLKTAREKLNSLGKKIEKVVKNAKD